MKFMLMFRPTDESNAEFERLSPQEQAHQVTVVQQWLADNRALSFARLQPPKTAKTVRIKGTQPPVVTDGPFIEAKEAIGGFALIEADDLDKAVQKPSPGHQVGTLRFGRCWSRHSARSPSDQLGTRFQRRI